MPGSIEITTVSHCKNVCTYCPQALLLTQYGKKEFMSIETFTTCLSKIPKDVHITFAGYAEPFLNPLCAEMIRYAYEDGRPVVLYTTLVGLTKKDIALLRFIKFINIQLHLPDNEGHMTCKIDDEYIENCNIFLSIFGDVPSHCYGPLHEKLVPLFPRCEIKKLTNEHLHTRANNVNNKKIELIHHERKTGRIKCDVVIRRKTNDLLDFNVLLPNGDVQICCMDYGLQHAFGNLVRDNYEDLFNSDEYKRVQQGLEDDTLDILCRTCKESKNV